MVNVSKQPLEKESYKSLFNQFALLTGKATKQNAASFLDGLLTSSEQMLLAKRVAAILMLNEGYSSYRVSKVLKMSPTTVGAMYANYQNGHYSGVLQVVGRSKAEKEKMWAAVELILRAGMPSRGKDRWKFLNNYSS